MGSTFLESLATSPVTLVIMFVCLGIHFYIWNTRRSLDHLVFSWETVVAHRQLYRVLTSTFTHIDWMHVLMNMGSLWNMASVETQEGSMYMAWAVVLLTFADACVHAGLVFALMRRGDTSYASQGSAGFSGVLFGLLTITCVLQPVGSVPIFGFNVPVLLLPVVLLAVTHILIPRASFLGHLSGIVAGALTGLGVFDWFTGWWFWTTVCGVLFVSLMSVKANAELRLGGGRWATFLDRLVTVSPEFMSQTGVGGDAAELAAASAPRARRVMTGGVLREVRDVDVEAARPTVAAAPSVSERPSASTEESTTSSWWSRAVAAASRLRPTPQGGAYAPVSASDDNTDEQPVAAPRATATRS